MCCITSMTENGMTEAISVKRWLPTYRQCYRESCSFAGLAFHCGSHFVKVEDFLHQSQAEPVPVERAVAGFVNLVEPLENVNLFPGRYADAVVGYMAANRFFVDTLFPGKRNADISVLRRELDCVVYHTWLSNSSSPVSVVSARSASRFGYSISAFFSVWNMLQ